MKRLIALTLAIALAVCLVACGGSETDEGLPNLAILYEQDDSLKNTYSMIAVSPDAPFVSSVDETPLAAGSVPINVAGANALIKWLSLASTRALISDYGVDSYGEQLFYLLESATVLGGAVPAATEATRVIRVSTTTSVNDSGLLTYLMPLFEEQYGYVVEISSAGTGAAIKAAKYGNADMILVHSKSQEDAFVDAGFARVVEGFSAARMPFIYNYFVLVGPKKDPAKAKEAATVREAFARIAAAKQPFVSRGDSSGTHTKEVSLWDAALGITAKPEELPASLDWYLSAGQGMGVCLQMANERSAYILTDKATYLTYKTETGKVG